MEKGGIGQKDKKQTGERRITKLILLLHHTESEDLECIQRVSDSKASRKKTPRHTLDEPNVSQHQRFRSSLITSIRRTNSGN